MADTLVDAVAASGTHDIGMFGPYWSDKDTAIIVFIDQSDDLSIRRTANAGATWSKTVVDTGTAGPISCYFDKETPDDTGDVVHIAWSDSVAGSIFYRGFNVASNSFVASKATVDGGVTISAPTNERVCITKTRSGNLIVAFETGTEIGCVKSSDAFATAGTIIDDVFEGAGLVDRCFLLPANTGDGNDAFSAYLDRSTDELSIKMYDDSANLWTETAVASSIQVDTTGVDIDAATRHSDGHILVAVHSDADTVTDDLKTWDLTPDSIASPGVTAKTDVFTDVAEAARVGMVINQQNDDVYVSYTRGTAQSATVDVFYKLSTNDMTSWGSETSYSEDTADDLRIVHGGHSVGDDGGRIQFSFFNDDLNDIFVNETNDIEIAAAAGGNDAAITLPIFTLLANDVPPATATLTLPVITTDALSKNHADATLTLPILLVSANDVPPATATLVLSILTVSGTGSAGGNTSSLTLPVLAVVSTAISLHGDASLTLPLLTVLSTSTVASTGDSDISLPLFLLSATDVAPATATITFPLLTVVSTAISLHGDASLTLPLLTVLSTSTVASVGNSDLTLPVLTVISISTVPTTADASITLPVLVVSAGSGLGGRITFPLLSLRIRAYNGSAPECVVMNMKNFAVTEYLNYGFNSMTKFNGSDLIADQNGIYEEDGSDTDHADIDDYPIKAHIKSGRIDISKGSVNRLRNAWVNYQSNGDIRMVTRSDKKETRYYGLPFLGTTEGINERRVKFQRGLRNRYVDFKTQNISGSRMEIDKIAITLEPVVSKRR